MRARVLRRSIEKSAVSNTLYASRDGEWGYIIISCLYLGWKPRFVGMPIGLYGNCDSVELSQIREIRFGRPTTLGLGQVSVEIFLDDCEASAFRFQVHAFSMSSLIKSLRRVSGQMHGAEQFDISSLRGFLNCFGLLIWFLIGAAVIAITFLLLNR